MKNQLMRTTGEEDEETSPLLSFETVASLDDLLIQILLRLPTKSLIRFKIVSKHWLALISDPQFALRRLPNPNPAVGIFHFLSSSNSFEYIPFDLSNNLAAIPPPFKNLIKSAENQSGVHILHSCNGLLLCGSPGGEGNYHLYIPTTKQLTTFPKPKRCQRSLRVAFRGLTLVFDPVKSRHYKVVCVRALRPSYIYQIVTYSSETGTWKDSSPIFKDDLDTGWFGGGVYCNGRVHWICGLGKKNSLCFNVEEEKLGLMPMPPLPDDWNSHYNVHYFGESCGCLHVIDIYGSQIQFNVYELKRDYSEWFVKYHVDLAEVANAFPALIRVSNAEINCYSFSIFSIIRGEKDDAFLVLRIPGKVIRFNLLSKTFEKLCDFEGGDEEDYLKFYDGIAYQYIESLCYV